MFVLFCAGPCPPAPAPRSESSVSPEKVSGPGPLSPASQLSSWSIPRRRRAVAQWHRPAASYWSELANSRLWLVEGLWAGALIALPHHHSVCDGKCQTVATPPTSGPEPPLAPLSSHKTRVTREWALKPQPGDHSAPMTDNSWSHPEPSLSLDIAISDRQYVLMFSVLLDQSDCLQCWSIWASDSPVQLFKIATVRLKIFLNELNCTFPAEVQFSAFLVYLMWHLMLFWLWILDRFCAAEIVLFGLMSELEVKSVQIYANLNCCLPFYPKLTLAE